MWAHGLSEGTHRRTLAVIWGPKATQAKVQALFIAGRLLRSGDSERGVLQTTDAMPLMSEKTAVLSTAAHVCTGTTQIPSAPVNCHSSRRCLSAVSPVAS